MFPNLASAISSEKVSFSKRFPNTDCRDKQIEIEKTNLKIFIFDESLFTDWRDVFCRMSIWFDC